MTRYLNLFSVFIVFASIIPHSRAQAQRDDSEWLAQCNRDSRYERRERFCEVRQQRMRAPGGTITVDGLRNGGVSVIGAERDSLIVTTRLQVQARTQSEAREIARQVRTVIRGSTIQTEGPRVYDDDDTSWSANLIVLAPRRSDLRLSSHNGPISVDDISGDMELETHNGPLALRGLSGNVRARTSNGPLSITLTGSKWTGAGLDAETNNGPLSLRIPEGYSAHLEAATENGPLSLGFPVTMVGRIGKNISTDLGSGGTTIRAITHNGPLSIERR